MLICFLMIAAFPIGPAFIGEDMLLQHATHQYEWLAGAIAIGFIFNGISLARIYTKVCLGPSVVSIPENSVGSGDFLVGSLPWSAGNRPKNVLLSDSSGNGT
jgi:formate hydrogenlyase subunit 3/multisubunit Na+/H+ antiporter MnhD subunit